jgi:hypothetical protein
MIVADAIDKIKTERGTNRVAILGSCVSSDIFRFVPSLGELAFYRGRSSLISLMSPPLELQDDDLDWTSNFGRQMIQRDFGKRFFEELQAADCGTLIVDFVDERWDVLRSRDSFVTYSADLMHSNPQRLARYTFERLSRLDPLVSKLWRDACDRFVAQLQEWIPGIRVVLHSVFGVDRYRKGRTVRPLAPVADGVRLQRLNPILAEYNRYFRSKWPSATDLTLPRTYVADRDHRWGLGPFHFEEKYYLDAAKMLRVAMISGSRQVVAGRSVCR